MDWKLRTVIPKFHVDEAKRYIINRAPVKSAITFYDLLAVFRNMRFPMHFVRFLINVFINGKLIFEDIKKEQLKFLMTNGIF